MFLTEEEFLVLTSFKMGLSHTQAKEKLGITIHTNDTKQIKLLKIVGHRNSNDISFEYSMNVKDLLKTLCIDIALDTNFERIKAFKSIESCKILPFKTDKNHQRI